jgi:hypothetical protein
VFVKQFAFILFIFHFSSNAFAGPADTSNSKRNIIPSTIHFQFAGFIGMFSGGAGYYFLNERVNTSLFYGYVPERYATSAIHTLALKTTLQIFKLNKPSFITPALYGGFTFNCEVSKHSFIILPDYYPKGYYGTQAIHFTFLGGLKARIPLSNKFALEPYAELGTLDSYLWYGISQNTLDADDLVKLALGVNLILK